MGIFEHLLPFALVSGGFLILTWHAKGKRLDCSKVQILQVSTLTKSLVICAALIFPYIIFDISKNTFELLLGGAVAVFGAISVINFAFTRVIFSNDCLKKVSAFGVLQIKWDDVERIYPSKIDHAFCVEDKTGTVIKIDYLIVGAASLEREVRRRMK